MLEISRALNGPCSYCNVDNRSHSIVFLGFVPDQYGNPIRGQAMQVNVELSILGSGRVIVDSSIPLGIDWQIAAKNAAYIVQTITETDFSGRNIIFSAEPIRPFVPAR